MLVYKRNWLCTNLQPRSRSRIISQHSPKTGELNLKAHHFSKANAATHLTTVVLSHRPQTMTGFTDFSYNSDLVPFLVKRVVGLP